MHKTEENLKINSPRSTKLKDFKELSMDEKLDTIYLKITSNNNQNNIPKIISIFLKSINEYYIAIIGVMTVLYSIKGFSYIIDNLSSKQILTLLLSVMTAIISNTILNLNEVFNQNNITLPMKFALALFVTTWILFLEGLTISNNQILSNFIFIDSCIWIVGLFISFAL